MEPPTVNVLKALADFYLGPGAGEKLKLYTAYLKHYHRTTTASQSSEKAVYQIDEPLLKSHAHIQQLVTTLRNEPTITRRQFEEILCSAEDNSYQEVQHAIRTLVRVGYMLDCALKSSRSIRKGISVQWETNELFMSFVSRSIPRQDRGILLSYDDLTACTAWRLKHRSGVRLEKTDDISDHLLYNPDTRVLKIFHQMAYLRAQLQRSSVASGSAFLEDSLKRGSLPPQLIIETLESFYRILFPLAVESGGHSKHCLKLMIKRNGFDPQCMVETRTSQWHPEDFQYFYWGNRLEIVAEIAGRTRTGNRYMAWIERHTSERQALTVAIIGLVFSAVFGFLACMIGAAQLAVQVVTWRYPNS